MNIKRILLFAFLTVFYFGFAQQPVKIAVITDVHYLSPKLAGGAARGVYEKSSGRSVDDLHAVLDVVLSDISKNNADILLITGDLTNHGERQSHLDFIGKLRPLQEKGMRIFVIPGNHDVNVPNAKSFAGDAPAPTSGVSADEFAHFYADFGYGNALRSDTASLSYLAQIDNNTWLLCLDTNRWREYTTSSISGGRILPQTMNWALEILREAAEKGITVLGAMHHGLVEHMPYQATFFADYLIDDWQRNAATLADAGLQVLFTGHFHANDVTRFTSLLGNTVYDVETGSLSQYPFPYRIITLNNKLLDIDTHFVDSVAGASGLQEKYRQKMEIFARRAIGAKLHGMGIPLSDEVRETLADLLARIDVLHVRGDEVLDAETLETVQKLAAVLGDEDFDPKSFQLDFPPQDNKLVIELGAANSDSQKKQQQ